MQFADELKRLMEIWRGFQGSRALLTANNLGLFEHLNKPASAGSIAEKLELDKRATEILLDALAGLGIIKKTSRGYNNSKIASHFLIRKSPYYQGDILRHADTMWHNWSDLDRVVKTGMPARNKRDWESFIRGMHNLAKLKSAKIIESISLKGVKTAIDIGGGPGTYSIELAKKGIETTLFDFAETLKIAREIAEASGVKSGIIYKEGDIIADELEDKYDLIFISQLFHAYSAEENQRIAAKAARALNPKGSVVVQEFLIKDNMTTPLESALFSINMLVNTNGGRCYRPKEMKQWFVKAGLKRFILKSPVETILLIARK